MIAVGFANGKRRSRGRMVILIPREPSEDVILIPREPREDVILIPREARGRIRF